jgi:radical SAM protein with 4Fe4S-binding SPASM domain
MGGEPLLAFDLIQYVVRRIEDRGTRSIRSLITNGTLLDRDVARFLSDYHVKTRLSWDGVAGAQDARRSGSSRVLIERVEELRDRHPFWFEDKVEVVVTVTPGNLPYLTDSVKLMLGLGVSTIALQPVLTETGEESDSSKIRRAFSEVLSISEQHFRDTGKVPVENLRKIRGQQAPASPDPTCALARTEDLTVDVDGAVYACAALCGSYQRDPSIESAAFRIGHLEDPGILNAITQYPERVGRHPLLVWARDRPGKAPCTTCSARESCRPCPASVLWDRSRGHHGYRVPGFQCVFTREMHRIRSRMPAQPGLEERIRRYATQGT